MAFIKLLDIPGLSFNLFHSVLQSYIFFVFQNELEIKLLGNNEGQKVDQFLELFIVQVGRICYCFGLYSCSHLTIQTEINFLIII